MSLIHNNTVPPASQHMTGHNADTNGGDETVNQLQRQPIAPEERYEAFPLYLVRLIRNRMEEMNAWR